MALLTRLRDPDVRNFAVYGLATGVAAVLTLLMTRVLWRALTPADFGTWSLVDPVLLPAASLLLFGIDHSIVKQVRADGRSLRAVTGTLLLSTLPASSLCLLVIGIAVHLAFHLAWANALLLTMAGEALILMMQTAFRATGAVAWFAAVLLSRNLLYLIVLLALQAPLSIGTVFLTRGGCVILVSLAAIAALRPVLRINWPDYTDALRYGFPLLLTIFVYGLADMTDRWFLAEFDGLVAAGLYAVHLKVAAILSQAVVIPFGLWFQPERFRRLADSDGGRAFFVRTATALALVCGGLSGAVWLARGLVLSLIAPGADASPLILACCFGAVICLALSQALNVGLLTPGHTVKNAVCTALAVVATAAAAAGLVPLFGMHGAAASRLLGALVLVGATASWSRQVLPIAFPYAAMLLYFGASAAVAAAIDSVASGQGLAGLSAALLAWTAVQGGFAALFWRKLRTAGGSVTDALVSGPA